MLMPTGVVTFLFTDIEGSTKLWESHPHQMNSALQAHDKMLLEGFTRYGGAVVKHRGEGDSFFVVFSDAVQAVKAALAVQQEAALKEWETPNPIRIRMALHTGQSEFRDGDYYGPSVNRCARLRAIAHGGQVLLSEVTSKISGNDLPEGAALRNLGRHALKDLEEPEQVFQLDHPDLQLEFPPLKSLNVRKHNLPSQTTAFIGREKELAEVSELLEETRLLSLLGPGGSGKTRLSLQAAAAVQDRFDDGVWQVELSPLTQPQLVGPTVAAVFGVKEQQGKPLLDALIAELAEKKLLLLMDNCEHLIEACATIAIELLNHCPGIKILTTSREPFNVAGETIWRIPTLALPEPEDEESVERLMRFEAVRLFMERATSANRAFALTEQNAAAVALICRRLDGIPLAIELGAARVKALSAEQIAQRLDDSFRLLTGGDRTKLPRQQTLRAMIDWSHQLISENERILWRRLSVFAGSFTLEAAERIAGSDPIDEYDVLDLITLLIDKSLVTAEDRQGITRYRMLETIRQYGTEKLDAAAEQADIRNRHFLFYLRLNEEFSVEIRSPHMQQAMINAWIQDLDNVRIAMDWGLLKANEDPGILEKTGRLLYTSESLWVFRNLEKEGRERLEQWIGMPGSKSFASTRAKVLATASYVTSFVNAAMKMIYAQECLELANAANDMKVKATAYVRLSVAYSFSGKLEEGLEKIDRGIALYREIGDEWQLSEALRIRMVGLSMWGDPEETLKTAHEGLLLCRRIGNTHDESINLRYFAIAALRERQLSDAREYLRQSIRLTGDLGDRVCTTEGMGGVSLLAAASGHSESAARWGSAFYAQLKAAGYEVSMFIHPESRKVWSELQSLYPSEWADGQRLTYEQLLNETMSYLES